MVDNHPSVLTIDNLAQHFGERTVLRLPTWSVPSAQHSLVLGASGSGKSTLLHLIAGLLNPSEETISVNGQALSEIPDQQRDAFRGRHLGVILQNLHLIPALSLRDNLRLAQSLSGRRPEPDRAEQLLEELGLGPLMMRKPAAISHGERQRAAIARALINRPSLLLADEPTSALDDDNARNVIDLLMQQATQSGVTLIVATHDQRITGHFDHRLTLETAA
ncbi:MAG: ATP-binding cassette domain-containing protein [Pseudomonadota bacterium]